MPLLFGYGTLRSDVGEHSYPVGKSLGFGRVTGQLWKIRNTYGEWAGVMEVEPGLDRGIRGETYGEVFEIEEYQLPDLDRREQATAKPPYYYRKLVDVRMVDGRVLRAFVYFAGPGRTTWVEKIPSGDWKDIL
jgi:gamma-glutamylcyclotransferase (GGCT)/AIG2-like uncharacterized protein YtfP